MTLLRALNSASALHELTINVIITPRAPSLVTGCHQSRVQALHQRQEAQPEAQDPTCPAGRVTLCQPHAFSAGDGVAWKGSTRGHSVATITLSDAGGGRFAEPLPTAP